jgi:hypothetical protein
VHLRESLLELAHGISSVPGDAGQKHNDDKCPKRWSAFFLRRRGKYFLTGQFRELLLQTEEIEYQARCFRRPSLDEH